MTLGLLIFVSLTATFSAQPHYDATFPLRLVGADSTSGRVEINVNGTWGTVCDSNWDSSDAAVVCRQLGLVTSLSVKAIGGAFFGQGFGPILMSNLRCSGYEHELADCPFDGFGHHTCSHSNDAGVICQPENIPMRLAGSGEAEGLVEIQINGEWGSICDAGWTNADARVVCRQLGFNDTNSLALGEGFFGQSTGPIYWQNVKCSGYEPQLSACANDGYGHHSCRHSNDAGVICHPYKIPMRLVGSEEGMGRVEIQLNGVWGSICDDNWDYREAIVVCRYLGFDTQYVYSVGERFFGASTGPIYWNNVHCTGHEPHLSACANDGYGHHTCTHAEDAGVICQPHDLEVRLVGAAEGEGRVEIKVDGIWGTICHTGWTWRDAQVVCNQLGFGSDFVLAIFDSFFGGGTGPIYLSNVACTGFEPHIVACDNGGFGHHSCNHNSDAGVICHPFAVRLVGGHRDSEGRLEISLNGQWGTVCDDSFDDHDAEVVCRQLGYNNTVARAWGNAHYGQGTGPIFLSDLACVGSEAYLAACGWHGFAITNCNHAEDVGVSCH